MNEGQAHHLIGLKFPFHRHQDIFTAGQYGYTTPCTRQRLFRTRWHQQIEVS